MSLFQWIRFGWLYQKMIRLGYCPKHNLPFYAGYEREHECQTCISDRMGKVRLAVIAREAKREVERIAAYKEMYALATSGLPPSTPECGDAAETNGARNIKNDAGEAARKDK